MPLVRKCGTPRCFNHALPGQRKCHEHARLDAEKEARRTARREEKEPWRRLYRHAAWERCKRKVRKRDGNKCVKCGAWKRLQVHHKARLAALWVRAGKDWDAFLPMATNPDICETLCPSCHKVADNELREQQGTVREITGNPLPEPVVYAPPRVPASQRRRRR